MSPISNDWTIRFEQREISSYRRFVRSLGEQAAKEKRRLPSNLDRFGLISFWFSLELSTTTVIGFHNNTFTISFSPLSIYIPDRRYCTYQRHHHSHQKRKAPAIWCGGFVIGEDKSSDGFRRSQLLDKGLCEAQD